MKISDIKVWNEGDRSVQYVILAGLASLLLGGAFLVNAIENVNFPPSSVAAGAVPPGQGGTTASGATQGTTRAPATPATGTRPAQERGATAGQAPAATASTGAAQSATVPAQGGAQPGAARNAARWAALLWAFACCAVGAFLGFIFGIPRSLSSDTARTTVPGQAHAPDTGKTKAAASKAATGQDAADKGKASAASAAGANPTGVTVNPEEPGKVDGQAAPLPQAALSRAPSTAVNTNLEQISDWLTKIIVGVSLVNSEKIGANMITASKEMASSFGGAPMNSLALAMLTYFSVIGLLGGYLLTRLYLQRAFEALAWSDIAGYRQE